MRDPKKQLKHCEITERDYALLRFLWKWKGVSTAALARKFFPRILPRSAYRRLMHLEEAGYLQAIAAEPKKCEFWALTDRGFRVILPKLGEMESKGHKSESPYHDFLCSAFHLGEWLTHQPNESQTYSEQQLRRFPADAWPEWVPRSTVHRPDGFSAIKMGDYLKVISFEAEISVKSRHRYEAVAAYYDSEERISLVFWLVDSRSTMKSVLSSLESYQIRRGDIHQFVLLSEFLKHGWMAKIESGKHRGTPISNRIPQQVVSSSSTAYQVVDALLLLDARKYPRQSSFSAPAPATQNAD